MTGRVIQFVLVACCCLIPATALGQWAGDAPGGPEAYGMSYSSPHSASPVAPAGWTRPSGAMPTGYDPHCPVPPGAVPPMMSYGPTGPHLPPGGPSLPDEHLHGRPYYGPEGIITTRVLKEPFWDKNRPIEKFLGTYFNNGYFRLEYMQMEIHEPGNELLGAPILGIDNPTEPFPVFDFQIPPQQIGTARVLDLSRISFRDIDGIRGTFGLPLTFGKWETSLWALEQASDSVNPIINNGEFIATSTLVGGQQATDSIFLYNQFFEARYTSDIWGAETLAAWHGFDWDAFNSNHGIQLQPVFGLRFLSVQEQLRQTGVFDDGGILAPPLTSVIDSDSTNSIFGTIVGVRAEYEHKWFTIGAEPRIGVGANVWRNRVTTERFRSVADGVVRTEDEGVYFSPIGEIQAYIRMHVTEDFTLSVGYNVIWSPRTTRPHRNIVYNDNGANNPPDIHVDTHVDELRIEGLTVGGELKFR